MFYNSATLLKSPPVPDKEKATAGVYLSGKTKGSMEEMSRQLSRFDQLAQDTHQIKLDLAVLTERAETFATKSDLRELAVRTESFATQKSLMELSARVDTLATRKELSEVRNDLNLLRVDVYKAITGQTKWLTACMFTVAVLSLSAVKLFFI